MRKRILAIVMIMVQLSSVIVYADGEFDEIILRDAVANTYVGTKEAYNIQNNINFTDVPEQHWAKEAITRTGALNIIKGYDRVYRPNEQVTNQEAIAFIMRAIGKEAEAQIEGEKLKANNPEIGNNTLNTWSHGYMKVAQTAGLITADEYADATQTDTTLLDVGSFNKNGSATRERVAEWIVKAINSLNPATLSGTRGQQAIYQFSDWRNITTERVPYVETTIANNIMKGDNAGRFNPKAYITRAELAQVMKNMDDVYFDAMKLKRTTGYIGEIVNEINKNTGNNVINTNFYIRSISGKVDKIITNNTTDPISQVDVRDIVVLKNNIVSGVSKLGRGDKIEYITNGNNEVLYINVDKIEEKEIEGTFKAIDLVNGTISIINNNNTVGTYGIRSGMIDIENQTIWIDEQAIPINKMPFSPNFKLKLKNNVVDSIHVIGEEKKYEIIRGIVKEIDTMINVITIIDKDNKEIRKQYNSDVEVEKNEYYNSQDDVGYIDQMFPVYEFDKRDSSIENIELGDVVEITLNEDDKADKISVDYDLIVKYGKVKQINSSSSDGIKVLLEYEDLSNELVDISSETPISKSNKITNIYNIMPGDWIKVLVKRVVLRPGQATEIVKEVIVNGKEEYISNIYRGELTSINKMQGEILISNSQSLYKNGWKDYNNLFTIKIDDTALWFEDGKRVSYDYADKFFNNGNRTVYVAVKKDFNIEKAIKLTFRSGMEQELNTDNINHIDGKGGFAITYRSDDLKTDEGTIVIRHGRLVEPQNIDMLDYAKIVLNGENKAAVVSITNEIDNKQIQIFRGRVSAIEEGKNFTVSSFSTLQNMIWNYVPADKKFSINYNTKIYDGTGLGKMDNFIDYTENSKIDKVYTVISKGGAALMLLDSPFTKEGAVGEIYAIDNGIILLKNVKQYNITGNSFGDISRTDKTIKVDIPSNAVIIKNSEIIKANSLKKGDQIRIITDQKPQDVKQAGGTSKGYLVFVEK